MSVISKILLKKDHNISSTSRDVIMKPILYTLDVDHLKMGMDEWQSLIMDTYKKLKRDSSVKSSQISSASDFSSSSQASSLAGSVSARPAQQIGTEKLSTGSNLGSILGKSMNSASAQAM